MEREIAKQEQNRELDEPACSHPLKPRVRVRFAIQMSYRHL